MFHSRVEQSATCTHSMAKTNPFEEFYIGNAISLVIRGGAVENDEDEFLNLRGEIMTIDELRRQLTTTQWPLVLPALTARTSPSERRRPDGSDGGKPDLRLPGRGL